MQQYLPYKDYEAMRGDCDQILEDLRANFRPDDDTGYLLVVDLHCPTNAHDMVLPPIVRR